MVSFTAKKVYKQRPSSGNHKNVKQNPWSKQVEENPAWPPWKLHRAARRSAKTSKENDKENMVCKSFISPMHG